MTEDRKNTKLLEEISEFTTFVKSLWGLLATGSLFFPFLNQFTQSLPYPNTLSKGPALAFAALGSSFLFLLIYKSRDLLAALDNPRLRLPSRLGYRNIPLGSHRTTFFASIFFLLFIAFLADYLNRVWNNGFGFHSYETNTILGVIEYALIFMLATVSFSTLATAEYMRRVSVVNSNPDDRWPRLEEALNAIYLRLTPSDRSDYKGFQVLTEKLHNEDNLRVLEVEVRLQHGLQSYSRYMIRVDSRGNVREFRRL
jgi:hypothetical protein